MSRLEKLRTFCGIAGCVLAVAAWFAYCFDHCGPHGQALGLSGGLGGGPLSGGGGLSKVTNASGGILSGSGTASNPEAATISTSGIVSGTGSAGSPLTATEVGDISSVVAGTGLSGGATSGAATLTVNVTGASCSAGQAVTAISATGGGTCAAVGSVTSVATNAGLTGGPITSTGTIGIDTSSASGGYRHNYNGSSIDWVPIDDPYHHSHWVEEFLNTGTTQTYGTLAISGTGAGVAVSTASGHPTFLAATTGSTTSGRSGYQTNISTYFFDGTHQVIYGSWMIPVLGTAVDQILVRMGWCDSLSADCTDGAYFEYDRATTSNDDMRIAVANNGSRTKVTLDGTNLTTTTTLVGGTWYDYKIDCTSSECDFYWGTAGSLTQRGNICTAGSGCSGNSATIPSAVARVTGVETQVIKNGGSTGTTSMEVDFDFIGYDAYYSGGR